MSTGRPTGRPPKDAQARSELRGRGRVQIVHAAPTEHARLVAGMGGSLVDAITTAAGDATWLRLADLPALILARQIAGVLAPEPEPEPAPPLTDEVGTVPAFPTLEGGGRLAPRAAPVTRGPAPLRDLAPMLVGLLSDLGMTPQARVRLSITLVEEPEPDAARPARMPRSAR